MKAEPADLNVKALTALIADLCLPNIRFLPVTVNPALSRNSIEVATLQGPFNFDINDAKV